MLKGGRIEKRWQPMSALTWCGPSSRSTSFIALKIGRSGQPVQKPGGRGWTVSESGRRTRISSSADPAAKGMAEAVVAPLPEPVALAVAERACAGVRFSSRP